MAEITKNNKHESGENDTARALTPLEPSSALLEGFTAAQVSDLARVKQQVAQGRYSDLTPEFKKLLFVKWLVEHDRLRS